MRLLYYSPYSRGGLADYSHHQANALARLGIEVTMLCPAEEGPWHRAGTAGLCYSFHPELGRWQAHWLKGRLQKVVFAKNLLLDAATLAAKIRREKFSRVLFGSFYEYLAPMWAGALRRLTQNNGTVFGAVVHDPVRDYVVGPLLWHRRSIAASYSILHEAFVHAPITLDTVRPLPKLRTTVIPQGFYELPKATTTRAKWRAEHGLPMGAKVLLSFGHLRDGKNLDLVLRMMKQFPELYLVVAGMENLSGHKPASFYRQLAQEFGINERCRWLVRYIPEQEVSNIFTGSDLVLLTYSRAFRSASAVLNTVAPFHIPFLASGGEGNLRQVVDEYAPSAWVEPDSLESLSIGVSQWLQGVLPTPNWTNYASNHSWKRNAEIVCNRMGLLT